jgi:hypothetical protein
MRDWRTQDILQNFSLKPELCILTRSIFPFATWCCTNPPRTRTVASLSTQPYPKPRLRALKRTQLNLDIMRPHKPLLVQFPLLTRVLELNLPCVSTPHPLHPLHTTRLTLYRPNTVATTLYNSTSANGFPRQILFPPPNDISASFILLMRAS